MKLTAALLVALLTSAAGDSDIHDLESVYTFLNESEVSSCYVVPYVIPEMKGHELLGDSPPALGPTKKKIARITNTDDLEALRREILKPWHSPRRPETNGVFYDIILLNEDLTKSRLMRLMQKGGKLYFVSYASDGRVSIYKELTKNLQATISRHLIDLTEAEGCSDEESEK